MQMPNCDCAAVDDSDHLPSCARYDQAVELDIADEVALEDGYRPARLKALMRHPSRAKSRKHFAAHPLPVQQDRRTA
jgi:hypothetical protein